jgi:hypothetical protein
MDGRRGHHRVALTTGQRSGGSNMTLRTKWRDSPSAGGEFVTVRAIGLKHPGNMGQKITVQESNDRHGTRALVDWRNDRCSLAQRSRSPR